MKRGIVCLLLLLLCGCAPNAGEPDEFTPVRVLGVDGGTPTELTAVWNGAEGQPPRKGSCSGENFCEARERVPWVGEKELLLAGMGWLIVGRDVDLEGLLFGVLEDRELSPASSLWLADEGAKALLEGCEDPVAALELLELQGVETPTAARALGSLLTDGKVRLPVLSAAEGALKWMGEEWWYGQ